MSEEDLDRADNALLYMIGVIEELIDKGLIGGPKVLTESGRKRFAELRAQGFRPTDDEMKSCLRALID